MANQAGFYGFRPVKMLGGAYNGQGQTEYTIGNNEASAIFQGDPVILAANGSIDIGSSAGAEILGIFNGCFYTDPTTGKPTFSNHYPGGIAAADIVANVIDDPDVVFEVKVDDANGGLAQVELTVTLQHIPQDLIFGISNVVTMAVLSLQMREPILEWWTFNRS